MKTSVSDLMFGSLALGYVAGVLTHSILLGFLVGFGIFLIMPTTDYTKY
jgi:MFS superfamily sulfate permease-like transporter